MTALFDNNVDVLSRSLDLYLVRHNVIADNIANAETPFYKARKVDFEAELQRAIEHTEAGVSDGRNLASLQPTVYEDPEAEIGQDLNTVDMDREMSHMAKNDVKYSATTQVVSKKFALLKYAIQGGDR